MNQVFINAAFTKAIKDYQENKDEPNGIKYNSFLSVVIRLLVTIYSELDIINPLMTNNDEALKANLTKYGYSKVDLDLLLQNLEEFQKIDTANETRQIKQKNPCFITIQKQLIDMLICKKMNYHLTPKEVEDFFALLYTSQTKNPLRLSYNYLMAEDLLEVENYFHKQMQENVKIVEPVEKNILNLRAYEILNYNIDAINSMEPSELDRLNHQVYDFFKIRETAINKDYLLEQAIAAYEKKLNKITTGNGYVDILLVMSAVATGIMILSILTFIVL